MNNIPNFEIPGAMRDLAEKSLDQARQAFDNFITAARRTASTARDSAEAAQKNAHEMSARTFEAAEQNVNAALELGQKLARAKSVQEAMQLQAEYVRSQFAAMQAQAKEFGGMAQSSMQQGAEQSRSAMQEGIDQTRKAVAQDAEAMRDTGDNVYELGRSGAP
ncbi:phasin [Methylobacterium planeticum]|uniref:Phasin n=1 Tax=Methylobacterium planeticum TaxID=2615211 RepID=A0A6N6MDU4_9HYPH|nr:phasin [Methylobacterium planeticum]KAB1067897.1 phasin [Methylobacterium planeticum]